MTCVSKGFSFVISQSCIQKYMLNSLSFYSFSEERISIILNLFPFFSNIPLIWKICSHDLTCKKTVRGIFLIVFSNILDDIGDLLFLPFHPSISGHWLLGTWSRIHLKVNGNCYYKIFILCGAKRSLYEYCLIMSTKMAIG